MGEGGRTGDLGEVVDDAPEAGEAETVSIDGSFASLALPYIFMCSARLMGCSLFCTCGTLSSLPLRPSALSNQHLQQHLSCVPLHGLAEEVPGVIPMEDLNGLADRLQLAIAQAHTLCGERNA